MICWLATGFALADFRFPALAVILAVGFLSTVVQILK